MGFWLQQAERRQAANMGVLHPHHDIRFTDIEKVSATSGSSPSATSCGFERRPLLAQEGISLLGLRKARLEVTAGLLFAPSTGQPHVNWQALIKCFR